jgi:hypothetical protein
MRKLLFPTVGLAAVLLAGCGGGGGSSSPDHSPPTVTSITPNFGPVAGGTAVKIFGTGFKDHVTSYSVKFGPNNSTVFGAVSDTEIDAITPFGAFGPGGGISDVRVTCTYNNPVVEKTSAITPNDHFTYN